MFKIGRVLCSKTEKNSPLRKVKEVQVQYGKGETRAER